jgi:hypothetical protein
MRVSNWNKTIKKSRLSWGFQRQQKHTHKGNCYQGKLQLAIWILDKKLGANILHGLCFQVRSATEVYSISAPML